ncbi:DUF551 domain-containing protein [Burkholderia ambifaria]|uniref:DUF551 domain-containing protein n=1 Tax=Burkholderia ambifaria TaxID=152480 RepID=UPI001FC8E984|nr:DUF551 domain-containing protein [Burkholderia ambifaria]
MTEREEFEAIFPMPPDCVWTGNGYAATSYNAWETHTFIARFEGWKAGRRTTPDREAWISVDKRLPPQETGVLVAAQFDHANDWRIKVGGLSCEGVWTVFGASWTPSHWMPLPTAPNGEKK